MSPRARARARAKRWCGGVLCLTGRRSSHDEVGGCVGVVGGARANHGALGRCASKSQRQTSGISM